MNSVRIFISSPGDLSTERSRAEAAVNRLQTEFRDQLVLEPLLWEQEPLLASSDFQSQIRSPADFDIFATIIGGRLGSPLGGQFLREDGSRYASGTEFEFEVAMQSYRDRGAPDLLVYRKRGPHPTADETQSSAVEAFFDKWFMNAEDQTASGAYHWFDDDSQFEAIFTLHMRKLLRRFLPRPNNIPTPISTFVGRTALLSETRNKLLHADTRLLCLRGPGGTGKTRIALKVAREALADFADGVFFISLANLRQAELIPSAISAVLDVKPVADQAIEDTLVAHLRSKSLVLVLDNLEQVQAASKPINALLSACPTLKILVTSRTAMRVTGAVNVVVSPLSLPDTERLVSSAAQLTAASQNDAVALFVERAQAQQPDFQLDESNVERVINICRRVDGLPLAIELATSRLRAMSIDRLEKSLKKRFAVLKGGADELLDHQKSLRELVAWSYELLTQEQQMLWRRMAVFAGGFDMEAAEIVCDPHDEFVVDVEVETLADHSLATIAVADGARVSMLDMLREFALEQLEASGELEEAQERFVSWVVDLADTAHKELRGPSTEEVFQRLDVEHANVLAALDYCDGGGEVWQNRALTIASGLWYHWFERGYMVLARRSMEAAAVEACTAEDAVRARALRGLGSIARFQKDLEAAERYCRQAMTLFTALSDRSGLAEAVGELGAVAISQNKLGMAADYLDQAIELRQSDFPYPHHLSFLLATRGVVHHLQGELDAAKSLYEESLAIGDESGDSDAIASASVNMGEIAEAEGDPAQAYHYYHRSLELFFGRGKKVAVAYCAEVLAGLSLRHFDDPAHAALLFGFAAHLRDEIATPIEPFNEQRLRDDIEAAQAALDESAFQAAWRAGQALHIEDLMAYMDEHQAQASD